MDLSHHPAAAAKLTIAAGERLELITERHTFIQHHFFKCDALNVRQTWILRKRLRRSAQVRERRAQSFRRQFQEIVAFR